MENGSYSGGGGGGSGGEKRSHRMPLSDVVTDCLRRWFQDTLKEAKAGDLSMQVLVSQMYYNGYGIPIDHQKAKVWMTRAARVRSSVWKVSKKPPGNLPWQILIIKMTIIKKKKDYPKCFGEKDVFLKWEQVT